MRSWDDEEFEYEGAVFDARVARKLAPPMSNGDVASDIVGGVIGFVCWLGVMATLGMVCFKIAAWAWS